MKKTKIICSIGPSSYDPNVMTKMVLNGMDVARINFSHATIDEREKVVSSVKEVRRATGKNVAILYDTKGPEFRCGMMEDDCIELVEGKTIRLVKEDCLGNDKRFSVNHASAIESLNVGNVVLLENDLMKIEVISKEIDGVTCKIIVGGTLGNKKSLSAPGVKLDIPFISDIDKEDIIYAVEHEADFIALSFVSTKEDVLEVRDILKEHNSNVLLISKIESMTGIENIKEILEVSDGVMVARGDLGVEAPMEELPFLQKLIINEARRQGKIAIVATEMLESMKKNMRPTRAEVSDIATAVLNGTDAVMLSGETTTGKYPKEAVKYMGDICENAEKYLEDNVNFDNVTKDEIGAISSSVVETASLLESKLIIAATMSGNTARVISNLRSNNLILATCTSDKVARSLALNFGVYPKVTKVFDTTDEIVNDAINNAKKFTNLKSGDYVIITGGFPKNSSTNFMRIERI